MMYLCLFVPVEYRMMYQCLFVFVIVIHYVNCLMMHVQSKSNLIKLNEGHKTLNVIVFHFSYN